MVLKNNEGVAQIQNSIEQETEEEREFRLKRLLVKAISDAKDIRINGKNYSIKKIVNVRVILPNEVANLEDGDYSFKAEANIHFVPISHADDDFCYGLTEFHGTIIKEDEMFCVKKPIVLDTEMGIVVNSLKPSKQS